MQHARCKTYITNSEKTAPTEFRDSWGRVLGALKFEVAPTHDLLKQHKSTSLDVIAQTVSAPVEELPCHLKKIFKPK